MAITRARYAKLIISKAWSGTWSESRAWAALAAIGTAFGVGLGLMLPATRTNLAWQVPVASVVVVWVYRLCAMSYREYAALETRAEEDALQLADKMNHQGLADELTKQHALGKRLIGTEDQQAFEAWKQKTVDIMVEYGTSVQDRHHFEDVTNFDLAGTPPGYTGTKRKHFVYVQRIADISTKHAQIAEQLGLDARRRRD